MVGMWHWMKLSAAILCFGIVLAQPVQAARQDSQGEDQGGSGAIIGYQPIPNSMLPGAQASQQVGQEAPMMPQSASMHQPVALQPAMPTQTQPGVPLQQRGNTGSYDYTLYLVGQGPYTLGRDDVIQIIVRNQPEFSGAYTIGPDGSIQYNYLGDIPLAGLTKYEVQQVLERLLERYIRVPQVTVMIVGYNSKAVYVIGEVHRPGKYIMRGDVIKLREAIVAAGLPTRTAALWRTHIVKPDVDDPRIRKINLKKILYKGKLAEDIDLYPGEIIVVPSTVLNSVNNFLSDLLNPFTRAASAASIGAGVP